MRRYLPLLVLALACVAGRAGAAPAVAQTASAPPGCEWRPQPPLGGTGLYCRDPAGALAFAWKPDRFDETTTARAEAEDPASMALLGQFYLNGRADLRNPRAAAALLRKAADKRSGQAMVLLGVMRSRGLELARDEAEAERLYKAAEASGDPAALLMLGDIRTGVGGPENFAEAARLYKAAADKDFTPAFASLGFAYAAGQGVSRDADEALRLFRAGADRGDARATYDLGVMYAGGGGVARDDVEAMRLFRLAADRGCACALAGIGGLYAAGRSVPRDPAEAVKWFRLAADRGDTLGMVALGIAYDRGDGVRRDSEEGARWLRKAADLGSTRAISYLGYMNGQRRIASPPGVHWAHSPSPDEVSAAYPIEAAVANVTGGAVLRCRLDQTLTPRECSLLSEAPSGYGFGQAALGLTARFRLKAGLQPGAWINLPIRFVLASPPEGDRAFVDQCAAYSLASLKTETLTDLPA
ncbi:MAG TPA: hypothetical protein VFE03_09450 [Caulobacteraceae bacterium]|nr:hypothetical protein [Caulobacteraceae bacterium]